MGMLTINRSIQQGILICNNLQIIVSSIHNTHVRLAIRAPAEVQIVRKELAGNVKRKIPSAKKHQQKGWLIVIRKEGESLLLGEEVEIKILKIYHKFVRLGIAAPRQMNIGRLSPFSR